METKVPGGKLARVSVDDKRVTLSGDFFIYPYEGVFIIEKTLSRLAGTEPVEAIESALSAVVEQNGLELVGLDVPTIARLYKGAADVESHRA